MVPESCRWLYLYLYEEPLRRTLHCSGLLPTRQEGCTKDVRPFREMVKVALDSIDNPDLQLFEKPVTSPLRQDLKLDVEEEIYLIDWVVTSMSTSYPWKAPWRKHSRLWSSWRLMHLLLNLFSRKSRRSLLRSQFWKARWQRMLILLIAWWTLQTRKIVLPGSYWNTKEDQQL